MVSFEVAVPQALLLTIEGVVVNVSNYEPIVLNSENAFWILGLKWQYATKNP